MSRRLEGAKRDRELIAICAQDKLESVQQQNTAHGRFAVKKASVLKTIEFYIGYYFDSFITACVFLSVVVMICTWRGEPQWWTSMLNAINIPLLSVFIIEVIIKHLGLGPYGYWSNPYHAFDGIITFMALLEAVGALGTHGDIALVFRIGRVFRLLKRFPQLSAMLWTLVSSVPAIANVFGVLFMIFFIFAVIGVNLFGDTRLGFSSSQDANMRDWQSAMATLFRCMTGNWRTIMYEQSTSPPKCTVIHDTDGGVVSSDCGSPMAAVLFHVSFQISTMFAVLNLVVAIIINSFSWVHFVEPSEITGSLDVSATQLRHLRLLWDRFDIFMTGKIPLEDLTLFLALARCCIPSLFFEGNVDQNDHRQITEYTAFGTGPHGTDQNSKEEACRERYDALVKQIAVMEKAESIINRLEAARIDITEGDDDMGIISAAIDNDIIECGPGDDAEVKLKMVRYTTICRVLLMRALHLDDDDVYACFGRDIYQVSVPGYGTCPLRPDEVVSETELDDNKRSRIRRNILKAFGRTDLELASQDDDQIHARKKKNMKRKIAEQITRTAMR